MLDLVRRTCDGARGLDDFEGVYEPDPEQVAAWQNQEAETYGGEMRYVNLGPQEVRRRLEACSDPAEREALEYAERAIGLSTNDPFIQLNAGFVFLDIGDCEQAREICNRLRESYPASSAPEGQDFVAPLESEIAIRCD